MLALALGTAPPARAASTDGGALTPGTPATATFAAAGDVETFTVFVPNSQRLTFTVADSEAPVQVSVSAFTPDGGSTGHPVSALKPTIGNTPGATRFEEFGTYPLDQHVTITLKAQGAGSLPFTPSLVTDPTAAPLAFDTPTTVTLAVPAQMVSYTLPATTSRIGLRVGSVALAPGTELDPRTHQPYRLSAGGPTVNPGAAEGDYVLTPSTDPEDPQPVTLQLQGIGGSTGTLVLTAFRITDVTATLTPGVPFQVDLSAPQAKAILTYSSDPDHRDRIEVTSSTLTHPDGTAGSAKVSKGTSSLSNLIGTVTNQPWVYEEPNPRLSGSAQQLVITPDGRSTGSFTIVVTAATDPAPIAMTVGSATDIRFATPNQSQMLTFPVATGASYVFTVTKAAMTSAGGGTPDATYISLRSPGTDYWQGGYYRRTANLSATMTGLTFSYQAGATGDLTLLVNPLGDMIGSLTLTGSVLQEVSTPLVNGTAVTATATAPSQRLVFTAAGATGGPVPGFHLEGIKIQRNSGSNPSPMSPGAAVTLEQGGTTVHTYPSPSSSTSALDLPSTTTLDGFDGTKPWQLVFTPNAVSIAAVSVTLSLPKVSVVPVRSGRRTTVSFASSTDLTRLTFDNPKGGRVLVRLESDQVQAQYELRSGDGRLDDPAPATDEWHGFTDPAPTGPLSLTVLSGGGTGTVVVTVLVVSDPSVALTVGHERVISWTTEQNPRLTFTVPGPFNTGRPVLEVTHGSASGWQTIQPVLSQNGWGEWGWMSPITAGKPTLSQFDGTPNAGDYTITLDPAGSAAGWIAVRLRLVTDINVTATTGQATTLRFTQPGQRATIQLFGADGQGLSWGVHASTVPATLQVTDGNGTALPQISLPRGTATGTVTSAALPPGSQIVRVTPVGLATGRIELTLGAVPAAG